MGSQTHTKQTVVSESSWVLFGGEKRRLQVETTFRKRKWTPSRDGRVGSPDGGQRGMVRGLVGLRSSPRTPERPGRGGTLVTANLRVPWVVYGTTGKDFDSLSRPSGGGGRRPELESDGHSPDTGR